MMVRGLVKGVVLGATVGALGLALVSQLAPPPGQQAWGPEAEVPPPVVEVTGVTAPAPVAEVPAAPVVAAEVPAAPVAEVAAAAAPAAVVAEAPVADAPAVPAAEAPVAPVAEAAPVTPVAEPPAAPVVEAPVAPVAEALTPEAPAPQPPVVGTDTPAPVVPDAAAQPQALPAAPVADAAPGGPGGAAAAVAVAPPAPAMPATAAAPSPAASTAPPPAPVAPVVQPAGLPPAPPTADEGEMVVLDPAPPPPQRVAPLPAPDAASEDGAPATPVVPPAPPENAAAAPVAPQPAAVAPSPQPAAAAPRVRPAPGFGSGAEGVRTDRLPRIGDPAPDPAAEAPAADVPVIADDRPPLQRFARDFDNPERKPAFAIVLIDTGGTQLDRAALAALPFPVTFALDPVAPEAELAATIYRAAGQEVVMLATGLPQGAQAQDVEVTFGVHGAALPEAVAVMDPGSGGFRDDRQLAALVAPVVAGQGRGLLSWDRGLNPADQVARRTGLARATIFRDLDAQDEGTETIRRYLDRAAFRAAQEGAVVVAGRTRPETVAALLAWAVEGRAATVALAPVTAVLRAD